MRAFHQNGRGLPISSLAELLRPKKAISIRGGVPSPALTLAKRVGLEIRAPPCRPPIAGMPTPECESSARTVAPRGHAGALAVLVCGGQPGVNLTTESGGRDEEFGLRMTREKISR
jgi:hypothetical protein